MEPEQFLSLEEFEKLKSACEDERERCILMFLAGAGLRVSEMIAIRVDDIDFDKSFLYIRSRNAKFGKRRTVVLLPSVVAALKAQLGGVTKGWVFPSRAGDHLTRQRVGKILAAITERAGLQEDVFVDKSGITRKRIHPHILRHSFAMWSLDAQVPLNDLQKQLGHASLATTSVYLEAGPNHRKESYMRSTLVGRL